ncbi:uncharacterized protein LOC102780328 [Neolamprologus brichardi]|uniref:uncharacterized protein LOC102780328 n=1 Tax=Neolamprologus brichardi TaxID=32507 RepID=UPI00164376C0|nr:uncharacterized protein LOC102780328 [Neolamprologus brichardi]
MFCHEYFLPLILSALIAQNQTLSSSTAPVTHKETFPPLWVVATPDYPVAAGQKVSLYCSSSIISGTGTWSWERLRNQTWGKEGNSRELILTKPEQSGEYRCCSSVVNCANQTHTVYIISTQTTVTSLNVSFLFPQLPTVGENLGITAFVFSLLILIIIIAAVIFFWLGFQKTSGTVTTSSTPAVKDVPGPEITPTGDLPQPDTDVYINYTSQGYADVEPANVTWEGVYSSLS